MSRPTSNANSLSTYSAGACSLTGYFPKEPALGSTSSFPRKSPSLGAGSATPPLMNLPLFGPQHDEASHHHHDVDQMLQPLRDVLKLLLQQATRTSEQDESTFALISLEEIPHTEDAHDKHATPARPKPLDTSEARKIVNRLEPDELKAFASAAAAAMTNIVNTFAGQHDAPAVNVSRTRRGGASPRFSPRSGSHLIKIADPFAGSDKHRHSAPNIFYESSVEESTIFTKNVQRHEEDGFKVINQYLILREIGRGNFGKVKLAADTKRNDKPVAIKIIPRSKIRQKCIAAKGNPSDNNDDDATTLSQAMLDEVHIMKKLKHPNIVRLHEVIDDPHAAKLYLVMQCVSRGPLLHLDANGCCVALELGACRRFMKQLCSALHYLHRKHVVHRDIKPDNILLGDDGRVYLSDFGVSSWLQEAPEGSPKKHGDTTGAQGTPLFMAPEVISGSDAHDGEAADVWSLGVTFYAMVYGELPFFGKTHFEIREAITGTEPMYIKNGDLSNPDVCGIESMGDFPIATSDTSGGMQHAQDLISKMLTKDPAQRVTLKSLAQHPLFSRSVGKAIVEEESMTTFTPLRSIAEDDIGGSMQLSTESNSTLYRLAKVKPYLVRVPSVDAD